MKENKTETRESKNLTTARNDAIAYSLNNVRTSVYQTGADAFVTSCCEVEGGILVGTWLNGKPIA